MKRFIPILLAFVCSLACAQTPITVISSRAWDQYGQIVPFAQIRVCAATSGGIPCTPTVPIFRDYSLTQQIANPTAADQYGNYTIYVPQLAYPNLYVVQQSANGGLTWAYVYNGPSSCTGATCVPSPPVYSVQVASSPASAAFSSDPNITINPAAHILQTYIGTNKLPRVDITHPDFGGTQTYASSLSSAYNETWTSGSVTYNGTTATFTCTNAADRTGSNDSGCAAASAVAYATTQCTLNACPSIYVPHGTFKISNVLRIPSNLWIIGDGTQASVLQITGTTANLITSVLPVNGLTYFFGGGIRDIGLTGSGHTTTGTLLEEQGAPLTLKSVVFYNHGGKGFVGFENTERSNMSDIQFLQVRQPEVIDGFEYRQTNVTIGTAGCAADNYCFGVNDINGVYPGPLPAADYTLVSATGSGSQRGLRL